MDDQDYATVSGEKVKRDDFAYAPPGSKPSEWKLPIHDASHVRNALARYNQTDLPADKKAAVYAKIRAAAKKFGIEISDQDSDVGAIRESPLPKYLRAIQLDVFPRPVVQERKELVEIPIAVAGTWVKSGRKFSITAEDLREIVANFEKRKNEMIVIDYEHASEMPEVARGGPVPAAGWIHGVSANGALKALVEWTPDARAMIAKGQYRFFSPAIDFDGKDKETGEPQGATLTSGALTNHPFLEELPPIALSELYRAMHHMVHGRAVKAIHELPLQEMPGTHIDGFPQNVSVGYPSASARDGERQSNRGPQSKGGKPVGKKLTFRKMADKKMFRKVFDDEGVELAEISLDDLDLDDLELETLAARRRGGMSEGLTDRWSDFLSEVGADQHDASVVEAFRRNVSTLRIEGVERAACAALLSETLKDGCINLDLAAKLADQGRLSFSDYRAVQKAHELVEKAIAAGKFLPADREFVSRLALSEPERFEVWARKKPRAVPLGGPTGVGTSNSASPAQDLSLRLTELMQEKNLSRPKALQELAQSDPELIRRWRWGPGRAAGS